jgi:glycosyltransferase involved in cell wall biosynthesis
MVSTFFPPESFGGDANFVEQLCRELARRGHEVDVIHSSDAYKTLSGPERTAVPAPQGITVHRLKSRWGGLRPLAAHQLGRPFLQTRELQDILQSKLFDVIHFHNISLFGPQVLEMPVASTALKLYTAHEHWLVCPLSVLWKNNSALCDKPSCTSCTIRAGRPPQLWRHTQLLRRASRSVDAFLVMSEASADAHRVRGFTHEMQVLHGFVDPPQSTERAAPHARPYFLFAGRLEKYKGVQDVIPLFEGDGSHDLLIVGTGGYEAELRRLAQEMPRVRFVEWQSADRLAAYYQHARALVAPSLTIETFGIVVIEAMAHGTPVVARDLGSYPELIRQSNAGLLFRDQEQLMQALARLESDDTLRDTMAESARSAYAAHWTPEIHVDRYLETIRALSSR